ncbi:putative metallo-hydrolase YflN [Paraconexibacter sp. AEG42_29]|uniref:Metallo-hydrolase YflN n=1 Tax=Paraconexibacter sp. AEG42_29 TaxID=2997339 RepID=A0AAU7AU80_9ACTN
MSVEQVTFLRVCNAYVVREDDGVTLVDTGPRRGLGGVQAAIARTGLPLRRILLTHAHSDHVAGVDDLIDDGVELIVGRRESRLMAGDLSLTGAEQRRIKARSVAAPTAIPTRLVSDGDLVGSLQVFDTPGHSPGHISLIDTRDGLLIAGDALTTLGRVAVSGDLIWRWPFPALLTWDKEAARQSAARLAELAPTRLATGHGPILDDAAAAIRAAVDRA